MTLFVCAVWIFLATRRPELHYHFAPLIAAALWPLSLRSQGRRSGRDALIGGGGAALMVIATTVVILVRSDLNGPNFLHRGPAWPEAVLFAILGAAIAARAASRERPGLLGSLVEADK